MSTSTLETPVAHEPKRWGGWQADPAQQFFSFVSALWEIKAIKRAAWTTEEGLSDVWLLLSHDHEDDEDRIYSLERAYRRKYGLWPVTVHVSSLDHVQADSLPKGTTLFERA